jgi:hypothetical protein
MLHNHFNLKNQLKSIQAALSTTLLAPRDRDKAQLLLQAAQKNVKDLNKKAASLQILYLEEQAVILDGNNDPKAAEIRKRVLKAEELKHMFKKLQSYLRPNQHSSLSHVMVPADRRPPKQATEWKRISDPEEVNTIILGENQTHFGLVYRPLSPEDS